MTTMDYFLWEYVKSPVYAGKPMTVDYDVKVKVNRVFADKRPKMLEKCTSRLPSQRQKRGIHKKFENCTTQSLLQQVGYHYQW